MNFNCGLSDCHNMVATSLRKSCNVTENKRETLRSYKNFDDGQLNNDLSWVPFHVAHIFNGVDDIYWAQELLLREVVDKYTKTKIHHRTYSRKFQTKTLGTWLANGQKSQFFIIGPLTFKSFISYILFHHSEQDLQLCRRHKEVDTLKETLEKRRPHFDQLV